jgi:hypothetical protein
MNKTEHMRKRFARQSELLRERFKGLKRDPDIWNLEYMITEIGYGSFAWRSGQIRTLRRAIRALERENKERGDQ